MKFGLEMLNNDMISTQNMHFINTIMNLLYPLPPFWVPLGVPLAEPPLGVPFCETGSPVIGLISVRRTVSNKNIYVKQSLLEKKDKKILYQS